MTDNDAIAANQGKHQLLLKIFQRVLPIYTLNSFAHIGGATPFENDGVGFLDFLSSTDIAAGAVEQYFTRKGAGADEVFVKDGADKILKWLCHDGIGLKKLTIKIENRHNELLASEVTFHEKNKDRDAVKVYVPINY